MNRPDAALLALAWLLPGCPDSTPPIEQAANPPQSLPTQELALIETLGAGELRARLDPWCDGPPADIRRFAGTVAVPMVRGAEHVASVLPARVTSILALRRADGAVDWLLCSEAGRGFVLSIDAQCRELWRAAPEEASIDTLCRLFDESGCVGVVLGQGAVGALVARGLDGREMFRLVPHFDTKALASHPRLPDMFVCAEAGLKFFDNGGANLHERWPGPFAHPSGGSLRPAHAVLVPGADGEARVIAAGIGSDAVPVVVCCNTLLHEDWRVRAPDNVTALALIDAPGRAPRCAVGTGSGDVLILDLDGCLRQQIVLSRSVPAPLQRVRALHAGPLPDGRYGLAVELLDVTLLYGVN